MMTYKRLTFLTLLALTTTACSSLSDPDSELRAVRILETDGVGDARVGSFTQSAKANGAISSCRVETTNKPITGELTVIYKGQRCEVEYNR